MTIIYRIITCTGQSRWASAGLLAASSLVLAAFNASAAPGGHLRVGEIHPGTVGVWQSTAVSMAAPASADPQGAPFGRYLQRKVEPMLPYLEMCSGVQGPLLAGLRRVYASN